MSGRFLDAYVEIFGSEEKRLALQLRLLRNTHGARRLMLAVLEEAIECCWRYARAYESHQYNLFRQAYRWIQSRDRTDHFAFESVCDALGVSAAKIRRRMSIWRESIEAGRTPRTDDRGRPRAGKFIYTRTKSLRSRKEPASAWEANHKEEKMMKTTGKPGGTLLALKRQQSEARQQATDCRVQAKTERRLSELDYLILGYLRKYERGVHGYELGRVLSGSPFCMPSLRLPQLYRVLRRLEHAELVECRVEAGGPRLRCLFTITPRGESSFRRWSTGDHRECQLTSDHLLNRLRFADELPLHALLGLIDQVERACKRDLDRLRKKQHCVADSAQLTHELYAMALGARLAAEQHWLEEVRKLVGQRLVDPHEAPEAAQVSAAL